jgi:hypothetical protein
MIVTMEKHGNKAAISMLRDHFKRGTGQGTRQGQENGNTTAG